MQERGGGLQEGLQNERHAIFKPRASQQGLNRRWPSKGMRGSSPGRKQQREHQGIAWFNLSLTRLAAGPSTAAGKQAA